MNFGVIILAAGKSERMGSPKMLLPWGRTTVVGHLVETWRSLNTAQLTVVHALKDAPIWLELNRLGVSPANRIGNPDQDEGMFGSILCAARWEGWRHDVTHFALVLGDQPHLPSGMLRKLIRFSAGEPNAADFSRNRIKKCGPSLGAVTGITSTDSSRTCPLERMRTPSLSTRFPVFRASVMALRKL